MGPVHCSSEVPRRVVGVLRALSIAGLLPYPDISQRFGAFMNGKVSVNSGNGL